eukprot:Phypoly_transcript_04126.p1 GENE.Phypoly_transcript_04126~~Phypoly_transcript_04126.p1  ORF type:complete len:331 (+),score=40.13 Phypoly_transcript_04126:151-1143(+)
MMLDQNEGEKKGVVWLNAWRDPVATLKAYSSHIELADLHSDGDYKLVVADLDKKLKIFKGTSLVLEHALLEIPVAVCCYYMDLSMPPAPVIAVAAGSHIYIYRSLKPFYKFTLPSPFVEAQEQAVWDDIRTGRIEPARAKEVLKSFKDKGSSLSTRSHDLLAVYEPTVMEEFVQTYKNLPLVQQTVITCMTTVKKSRDEVTGISCLVVGTENGQVIILDPTAGSILKKIFLKSAPAFIVSHGIYDVEYRLTIACRNGILYNVKNGDLSSSTIELEVQPVGLVRIDKHIVVGCMDNSVHAYQLREKKDFTPCGTGLIALMGRSGCTTILHQ